MSDGVTAPSPNQRQHRYADYHTQVEWFPIPQKTTTLPIHIHLFKSSTETEPSQNINFLHSNHDIQFAELTRVLGDMNLPSKVQQNIVANMSELLGLGNNMDGATDNARGYFDVAIRRDDAAASLDLNIVPDDEEDMVTIDLNVEPDDDDIDMEAADELIVFTNIDIDFHYSNEDVDQMMNHRDTETADHDDVETDPPLQYPYSSLADLDNDENALYFSINDLLRPMDIDFEAEANDMITILESMEAYTGMSIPASKSAIEELEKVGLEGEEAARHAGSCIICMEEFEAGVEATRLPCSHLYHGDCVVQWLEIQHQCPLCRFAMPHI